MRARLDDGQASDARDARRLRQHPLVLKLHVRGIGLAAITIMDRRGVG